LALAQRGSAVAQKIGAGILWFAPWLMRTLSVVGTAAMFMVGGGILTHGVGVLHHWIQNSAELANGLPYVGIVLGGLLPTLINAGAGVVAGVVILAAITLVGRLRRC
jgi:predicted DNA repair protein MutK